MNTIALGLEITGAGLLIVFSALFLVTLIICIYCNKCAKSKSEACLVQKADNSAGVPAISSTPQAATPGAPVFSLQGESPENVATAMGAIFSTLEGGEGRRFAITSITKKGELQSNWAQAGRSRLMNIRQDLELRKRGILR